jgi:hypothetical protein
MSKFSLRGLFGRRGAGASEPAAKDDARSRRAITVEYLRNFIDTRVGVEAYVEPATASSAATLLLIATTGEWTRRAVPSEQVGWKLARELGIPVYDVNQTGYPPRMRAWTRAQRDANKPR